MAGVSALQQPDSVPMTTFFATKMAILGNALSNVSCAATNKLRTLETVCENDLGRGRNLAILRDITPESSPPPYNTVTGIPQVTDAMGRALIETAHPRSRFASTLHYLSGMGHFPFRVAFLPAPTSIYSAALRISEVFNRNNRSLILRSTGRPTDSVLDWTISDTNSLFRVPISTG